MLKIGVLGTGHLGKIHLKCIQMATESYELVGFFDPDEATSSRIAAEYGIQAFPSAESLMDAVEVVDIVTPTTSHFDLARQALLKGKHIFIEKPLTHTLEEAETLVKLHERSGVKVQVGHVERFNPALLALDKMPLNPMFVEAHRLAMFNPRGTDVSVVLDLMIHDLDILLSMVPAEVKHISASGVPVVSDTPDIANARIEFENGCVANLTASRISIKQMRKVRLFQQDAYISLDFLDKQAQIIRLFDEFAPDLPHTDLMSLDTPRGKKLLQMQAPEIEPVNAIKMELESLATSIRQDSVPPVSIEDGYKALRLAYAIIEEIEQRPMGVAT